MKVLRKFLVVACLSLLIIGIENVLEINPPVNGIGVLDINEPIKPHH